MALQSPICVVVAVRNVAEFVSETLESLLKQTFRDWAAIVVDDGSTDATAEIVTKFAAADARIILIRQNWKGVSAARNAGIASATSEWLLFLDGDDTIAPDHLEKMMAFAQAHPDVGAVHCGWARFRDGQNLFGNEYGPDQADMFDVLAVKNAFVIHACLVRRQVVLDAGNYDETMSCCVDWDLWQRIALRGTKFGFLREVLAFVRVRSGSVSSNMSTLLSNGLKLIRRGHRERRKAGGASAELLFCGWCAGVLLGKRQDPAPLLSEIPHGQNPGPAISLSKALLHGILFGSGLPIAELPSLLRKHEDAFRTFLRAIEKHVGAEGLAWALENEIAEDVVKETPSVQEPIWTVQSVVLDLTRPLHDIRPHSGVFRIVLQVHWRSKPIGKITLPVVDALVSREVIADAVAAKFAWQILGEYFKETAYRARSIVSDEEHDSVGWDVFLQELWGTPQLKGEDFYRLSGQAIANRASVDTGMPSIEIGMDPATRPESFGTPTVVMLGGQPMGVIPSKISGQIAAADDWIAAINFWSGFELCQIAVRELVIGWPVDGETLRDRLRAKMTRPSASVAVGTASLILGRRFSSVCGTSASRRYMLAGAADDDLKTLAERHKEPVKQHDFSLASASVIYEPGLISPEIAVQEAEEQLLNALRTIPSSSSHSSNRARFESLFARAKDPWGYTNEYEQIKYEQTASLLHGLRIKDAVELACAEGHFTVRLAPLVEHLTATDISEIALSRAQARCAGLSNVVFQPLDFALGEIAGPQDLIVCSEALYYLGSRQRLDEVACKIAGALRDGGYFLTAHANQIVDSPNEPGFDWGHEFGAKTIEERFQEAAGLKLFREIKTPLYRVQLFAKNPSGFVATESSIGPMGKRPESKLGSIRWNGGKPTYRVSQASDRLPILMYHSVAPSGDGRSGPFQITPEDLDRQVAFLKASGYYSVSLDEWRTAMFSRRPLPGNPIILTFDDGYLDFYQHAWPILKKHGFSAIVFSVTGLAGSESSWSQTGPSPLMSWSQMRELQTDGVQFGSHTHTHRVLRRLPFEMVVKELAHSRLRMEDELGTRVTALAYPYGDKDECIEHFAGGCGYLYGLGIRDACSRFTDSLLDLPRINVNGSASFEHFVSRLWDDYWG